MNKYVALLLIKVVLVLLVRILRAVVSTLKQDWFRQPFKDNVRLGSGG